MTEARVLGHIFPGGDSDTFSARLKQLIKVGRGPFLDIRGEERPFVGGDPNIGLSKIIGLTYPFIYPTVALRIDYENGAPTAPACVESAWLALEDIFIEPIVFSGDKVVLQRAAEISDGKLQTGLILPGNALTALGSNPLRDMSELGCKHLVIKYDPKQADNMCKLGIEAKQRYDAQVWTDMGDSVKSLKNAMTMIDRGVWIITQIPEKL